ncbi:MAG: glycosyltransferase family 39 protein [Planctomycetaceae bacterium]|nr:glycosyltransferase family 39 protein [Planctomycetaceae bacterium]
MASTARPATVKSPALRQNRWHSLQRVLQRNCGPIVVAWLAGAYVLCHLDPAGSYPGMPQGPGLTIDETFNVQQGVVLVEGLRTYGIGLLSPEGVREVFSPPLHLPDHPPLGRLWLGLHHHLVWWLAPPEEPEGLFVTACARAGSATAFALTILLVGCCTTAWYGQWAGLITSLSFFAVPRLLGHAHIAALESCTNLTYAAATLAIAAYWDAAKPPTPRTAAWTGILFGLALLTKIQAVILPIPIILWALMRWRGRSLAPLVIWGGTACLVFFSGWPWLWLDPAGHLAQYLRGATDRSAISVWYLGKKYADRDLPWNYSVDYFLWTIPVKLQVIGFLGSFVKRSEPQTDAELRWPILSQRFTPRDFLIILASLWPLWFFAIPGIPVYDCERLWLPAIPLWLILVGRGSAFLLQRFRDWRPSMANLFAGAFLGFAVIQTVMLHRFESTPLSFYAVSAGGLEGAVAQKLELNYWGDAITRSLLEEVVREVPRDSVIAMAPVLHQFQTEELRRQSPILRRHGVRLVPYESGDETTRYLLIFQRLADLPPELQGTPENWKTVSEVTIDNVQLAALLRRRSPQP